MSRAPLNKVSYEYKLQVKKEHLDALKHVNNIVYIEWVQEAAERHWNSLASDPVKSQCVWVALRHEIDYLGQAFLGDSLMIYTWIDSSKGAKSIRIVQIYKDDQLLTQCKTTWVMLDSKTFKAKRIGPELIAIFSKD